MGTNQFILWAVPIVLPCFQGVVVKMMDITIDIGLNVKFSFYLYTLTQTVLTRV